METREVRQIAIPFLVGSGSCKSRGRVTVFGVDNIRNRLSPEEKWKTRVNENGSNTLKDGAVETFRHAILLGGASRSGLVGDATLPEKVNEGSGKILATIVGSESLKRQVREVFDQS